MLRLVVPGREWFDETNELFMRHKDVVLTLEHSLLSISKWEAKWKVPFLETSKEGKTREQSIDYIRCMTINQNVDPLVYYSITPDLTKRINDYIGDPMTATFINRRQRKIPTGKKEPITSELIYYWMVSYQIPFECQKWHLNRLLTLIDVFTFKNEPKGKMSKNELLKQNMALNEARRKAYNTRG